MQKASFRLDQWPSIVEHVSSVVDVSARTHKDLVRKRGVRSAAALLHLALLYCPGWMSLRSVASHATEAGIVDLCDVSLLDRLRNAGDFLADVFDRLLADRRGDQPTEGRLHLALVDGSTVSIPGSKGSDWRLHARYEPARGCFTDRAITEATTAEALCCVAVRPGDVLVQDRGYARVRNFAHARANQADFITRIGWRSVKLLNALNEPSDLIAALSETGPSIVEHGVSIGAGRDPVSARLIIARKPPEATERQRRTLRRKASSIVHGAPDRGSSCNRSIRWERKRRRHLPTVIAWTPRRAAISLFCRPAPQARMIRARGARAGAVLRRPACEPSSVASASVSTNLSRYRTASAPSRHIGWRNRARCPGIGRNTERDSPLRRTSDSGH